MNAKDAVVKRIISICKQRNIKLNELANISGITPSTIYSMTDESRRDISILTIKKICDGLDINLTEFFNDPVFESLEQEIK
ncbi:MAG: helix-turn-helix transcriptional regulator [Eubacterium sp.]|jgi:DNA-binding Xre family transcriptional regulator|nr:helix-turn-helix transcriptional regulator [Eubacterium sp.]